MDVENEALWLGSARGMLRTGPAPYPTPGPAEVVVRVRAVAVNPVDTMTGMQRRLVYPWLSYPAVLGTDVAGEVVEVGPGAGQLEVGDRVAGLAIGQERHCDRPSHGAFQRFVVLPVTLTTPLPAGVVYADAAVLPLAVATASAGLFGRDQLALAVAGHPTPKQPAGAGGDPTVIVWGASTSVGLNAIQLARHAGFRVVATASPHHHGLLLDLGAARAFDYRDPDVVALVLDALDEGALAGVLAIGAGSLRRTTEHRSVDLVHPPSRGGVDLATAARCLIPPSPHHDRGAQHRATPIHRSEVTPARGGVGPHAAADGVHGRVRAAQRVRGRLRRRLPR